MVHRDINDLEVGPKSQSEYINPHRAVVMARQFGDKPECAYPI
tara:strand:- start:4 stop:132 length:129 start_codon:yes stop_codon:yes gene_type:complete